MKKVLLVALVVLAVPALATDYTGPGGVIVDNQTVTSPITVPDSFTITGISVAVNALTHTWCGDLIATLTNGSTSVDLINRIGRIGGSGFGDSSNFGGSYSFFDTAAGDMWAVAASGDTSFVIPGAPYKPTTVDGALSSLNSFVGANSLGTWTLSISDNAGGDTGSFSGWTLTLIPEPASLALLGLGVLLRRR
jgi:hypothetical protein